MPQKTGQPPRETSFPSQNHKESVVTFCFILDLKSEITQPCLHIFLAFASRTFVISNHWTSLSQSVPSLWEKTK
jgi:hypothetical protein